MAEEQPKFRATHQGELPIGKMTLSVAVLDNRERVVSVRAVATALGVKGGGAYWKEKKENPDSDMLPEFISAKNIQPYALEQKTELLAGTIPYISQSGQEAVGIKAELLPRICNIWVKALSDGVLTDKQRKVAEQSRILLGAFAEVGITALVDEATGFQKEQKEYQKILERYIAKELQPWIKVFGEDYYFQIYRLKGWDWNRFWVDRKNHPWSVANITNRIIYEKLPDGVIDALKELAPANRKGNRPHRLHQHLSPNEGQVALLKHLGAVVNIMERYGNGEWETALHEIDRRFASKRIGNQPTLDFNFTLGDKNIFNAIVDKASKPDQEAKKK